MSRFSLAFLASIALASACSPGAADQRERIGRAETPIIGGVLDDEKHDAVVFLLTRDEAAGLELRCTGTLIAPDIVATARHCVSHLDETVYPARFAANYPPASVGVYLHVDPQGTGAFHSPDVRGKRIVHEPGTTLANADFALVVLEKPLPVEFAQVRIASSPRKGQSVLAIGYGVTEDTTATTPLPYRRHVRDPLTIALVGPIVGTIGDRELTIGESICQGDSGGPVMDHGTQALLAVTSRGGNGAKPTPADPSLPCRGTVSNIFTRLDGYETLIRKTLGDYGRIPWEEGAPKPPEPTLPLPPHELGGYCANDDACVSKLCIEFDEDRLCSQACDDATPCPGGYRCESGSCVPGAAPAKPDAGAPDALADADATDAAPSPAVDGSGGCALATERTASSSNPTSFAAALLVVLVMSRRHARRSGA